MDEKDFLSGKFEEAIDTLKDGQASLREELRLMHADLLELKLQFASAKAGWRMMVTIGTVFAGVAGYFIEPILRALRIIKG